MSACAPCLRRAGLIEQLSGAIEVLRRERTYVRDVLALCDRDLLAAVGTHVSGAGGAHRPGPDELRARALAAGLKAICRHDDDYPERLLADAAAPPVLYLAGSEERWRDLVGAGGRERPPVVAVVGTRRASQDGIELAAALGRGLSAAGVTVVSGMALGIDGAAHDGALAAGARTVAVLAGGADRAYPRRRAKTHAEIVAAGAVISESAPGRQAWPWNFLARNRIIAGLGDMTVVVEAAERSGSLVTAEMALESGREVAAVPGSPLSWRSRGVNSLIRDGAHLVRGPEDVLSLLGSEVAIAPQRVENSLDGLDPAAAAVLKDVIAGRDTLDALAPSHGGAAAVQAALVLLELEGRVVRAGGGRFRATGPHGGGA